VEHCTELVTLPNREWAGWAEPGRLGRPGRTVATEPTGLGSRVIASIVLAIAATVTVVVAQHAPTRMSEEA
jgi:hypothetical protein